MNAWPTGRGEAAFHGRLRRETRQPDRGRSAEVWIPVPAEAA
jgi:hypothetical protein